MSSDARFLLPGHSTNPFLPSRRGIFLTLRWVSSFSLALTRQLTNEALTEIVRLVPLGLKALFSEQMGTVDSPKSIVTLLPPSPSTSLPLLLLSLASQKSNPLVVLPSRSLLPAALESKDHPAPGLLVLHESALTDAVDLDFQDLNGAGILLVGDPNRRRAGPVADAIRHGVNVKWWEEIWDAAEDVDAPETEKKDDTATSGYFCFVYALTQQPTRTFTATFTSSRPAAPAVRRLSR